MAINEDDRLVRDTDIAALLGCSRATVWRRVADGTIPPPIRIGGTTRWLNSEVRQFLEQAKAKRSTK